MGIELARAFVSVRGDASQLPADLSGVRGMIEDALSDARMYAAGFLAKFSQMSAGFVQMGRGIVARNEQTLISFETMIGSIEETKALLKSLTDFAVKTPFEMPQLLSVTQELLTFGERGEELMKTIKMLGDASQGNAQKFATLGLVFNQMRAIGKFTTQSQDFRQLSSRGIISMKDMAQYLKKTDAEVSKMTITFEDVRGALEMMTSEGGRYYNAMSKQSNSLIGLQSTYNDAWNILASKIAEVSAPLDKLVLKFKIDLVSAIESVTSASHGMVGGVVQGASAFAKMGAVVLAGQVAMRLFGASVKTALIGTGIAGAIIAIGGAIGGLISLFSHSKAGLRAWGEVSKDFQKIWVNLREAFVEFGKSVSEGFENAFGVSFTEVLGYAADKVADFIISVSKYLVSISEKVKFVMDAVSFIFRNGWELLSMRAIDFSVSLIDSIQSIQLGWRSFTQWMEQASAGLGALFTAVGENLLNKMMSIKDKVVAELAAAWAGIKAVWNKEDPFAAMDAAFEKSMAEANKNNRRIYKDPIEEFNRAFREAQRPVLMTDLVGDELEQGLLEQKKLLQDQINAREMERERRRTERAEEAAAAGAKEKEKKAEASILKTGRYGFEQFGSSIQDAILKGAAGDKQGQMVNLLENGNKIQAAQLEELQNNNPGGLGP